MLSRSCLSPLSIKLLVKSEFPNSSAEKVVDVIIAMPVLCCKVPVDHGNVSRRGNILIIAAPVLLIDIGHILAYPHDLTCFDERMRPPRVLFVLLEVVFEHGQGVLQSIDARGYTLAVILANFSKSKTIRNAPLYKKEEKLKIYNIGRRVRAQRTLIHGVE